MKTGAWQVPAGSAVLAAGLAALLTLPLLGLGRDEPAGAAPSPTTTAGLSPLSDRRVVTGWIPWWDFSDGVDAAVGNADVVAEISPFWYRATLQSQVQPQSGNGNPESMLTTAIDQLQSAGIAALPSVTDEGIDAAEMAELLSDAERRGALLSAIVAMVERTGADGADIDFEAMNFGGTASDKTTVKRRYPLFLENLRGRLNSRGALLSVAVPSRRSASDPNWAVFDYGAIARSVDRARIMTYDYSTEGTGPGPIAPIDWTREVMTYAASEFSRVPLSVGVPAYGQNWPIKTISGSCPSGVGAADTVSSTSQQALGLIESYGATPVWSQSAQEYRFDYERPYSGDGKSCVVLRRVWFGEGRSAEARLRLAGRLGIQGIAVWRFGDEDPALWTRALAVAEAITPDPARATLTAPVKVAAREALTMTARFTVSGLPVVDATAVVQKRAPGGAWKTVSTLATNATGRARYDTTARRTLDWRMRLTAGWDWDTSLTRVARVKVLTTTAKAG